MMSKDEIFKGTEDMRYIEIIEYLNGLFLKANTKDEEQMIIDLIESLRAWGK